MAPMKLLVDTVRASAHRSGYHVFHLGGGTTTAPDDSLLLSKKGFSDRLPYVLDLAVDPLPGRLQAGLARRTRLGPTERPDVGGTDYSPAYRAPTRTPASVLEPAATIWGS